MARTIAFDVTHLASRLPVDTPSGIDKVDLAFARSLKDQVSVLVHYGLLQPRFHKATDLQKLADAGMARWGANQQYGDDAWDRISSFLTGHSGSISVAAGASSAAAADGVAPPEKRQRRLQQLGWRLTPSEARLPKDSIYLNVAQHIFEEARFFRWLSVRRDILSVFMVHDFLPLDYPEYFRPGYKQRFQHRTQTILTHARAILAASRSVKERIEAEYDRQGRACVPIHVEALPSSLPKLDPGLSQIRRLSNVPYFVVLGTIEPRKNHLLLLNIWRRLAERHQTQGPPNVYAVPKLIIVGARGWENEQVVDILERSALVKPHILEVSNLDDVRLAVLIANARGLLFPSFAEGYGLPLVEALALKTPVIASDIPVCREVVQGCALFASPLDGPCWLEHIVALSNSSGPQAAAARELAQNFLPPTWEGYFDSTLAFLKSL